MPRVVPSDVVAAIDRMFPPERGGVNVALNYGAAPMVAALVDLAERVPAELLTLSAELYADFLIALSTMRTHLDLWVGPKAPAYQLVAMPGLDNRHPVAVLREALRSCPDVVPAPATVDLPFISDPALKAVLRTDISAANQALGNGEWKAATVLAGSVVEALLLSHIQQTDPSLVSAAVAAAPSRGVLKKPPSGSPDRWEFIELVEVAAGLGRLKPRTAQQCHQARGFRNLIHPGNAQRVAEACNRGTALAALAAVELVVADLS